MRDKEMIDFLEELDREIQLDDDLKINIKFSDIVDEENISDYAIMKQIAKELAHRFVKLKNIKNNLERQLRKERELNNG